jgi:predicted phage baseplate assembly protein
MSCRAEGIGVNPADPPMVWEAWDGNGWTACEVDHDTTGAFNRDGDVVLHVPASHTAVVLGRHWAGWLRCRLVEPASGQRFFDESPRLRAVAASTIGGTVPAVHADVVREETLGLAEGVPGQRFPLSRSPVVGGGEPVTVEVSGPDGWQTWREVESFAFSEPADRHVMLDRMAGELVFGPAVRLPDGSLRHYGAVPPKGAAVRVCGYRTGGGLRGNLARGVLQVQRDPVPFVSSVTNRKAATGGVDAESVRDAAVRGPLLLRTRDRAVTAEDYEQLAREAAPEAARVRCITADEVGAVIRVLVVPALPDPVTPDFASLKPDVAMLDRIRRHLDERRCLGARIRVEPPFYHGVTVVASVRAGTGVAPEALRTRATAALYAYLNPVTGGLDGSGWPFGRPVAAGEIFAVLQRLPGVEIVDDVRLFAADPITGKRGGAVPRIDLAPHALVFSYGHQVRADRGS